MISTAIVYFKRFYVRNSLKCVDPLLLAPTCIFLASKVEEFGVISNSRLITTCQSVVKNKFSYAWPGEFTYRINHVFEVEFYLLELMVCRYSKYLVTLYSNFNYFQDCCLILYHPYRPLVQFIQDLKELKDTKDHTSKDKDELQNQAWNFINDTYRTDIPLLYPPHLVAIGWLITCYKKVANLFLCVHSLHATSLCCCW